MKNKQFMINSETEHISNLKFLMMMTVVLFHSCLFFTGTWFKILPITSANRYISVFAEFLNSFQTQVFTLAAGYLFFYLRYVHNRYQTLNSLSSISPHL